MLTKAIKNVSLTLVQQLTRSNEDIEFRLNAEQVLIDLMEKQNTYKSLAKNQEFMEILVEAACDNLNSN